MPRKPRIHYPGAVYHVMLRGNDGQPVFFDPGDRTRFFLLLQQGTERFEYHVHAYCLMTNHVHLVIQVGSIPLARIMQNLGFRFTLFINVKRQRTGHLFQGRYKALLLDADSYLLELVRYVHMNPVRAGMVSTPDDYPWSSHHAYLGREKVPWLTTDWILCLFSGKKSAARRLYQEFVQKEEGLEYRREFMSGHCDTGIVGDENFAERVLSASDMRVPVKFFPEEIIAHVCRAYRLTPGEICAGGKQRQTAEARSVVAWLARETEGASLSALAGLLNREATALCVAATRLQARAKADSSLKGRMEVIRDGLIRQKLEC